MTDNCRLCKSSDLAFVQYGNHLNTYRWKKIRLIILKLFPDIIKFIRPTLNIENALLFCSLYKISICNSCGYGIYDRDISTIALEKYYKTVYWQADGINDKSVESDSLFLYDNRAIGQIEIIRKFLSLNRSTNILEIGAGPALFSRLIHRQYPQTIIDVIEPGLGWEKYYKKYGINKVADFFSFLPSKKYHYIHASHWLEHVNRDIENVTNNLNKLVFPGGLLFIEVPNCDSGYWDLDVGDTPHIHFFTEQSLILLFEKAGFELLSSGTYGETHEEAIDYFHPCTKKGEPDKSLILEVEKSIRESIPRKDGTSIRALFRKTGRNKNLDDIYSASRS